MNFILKVNVTLLLKKDLILEEASIKVQSFSMTAINLRTKKPSKTSTDSVSRF